MNSQDNCIKSKTLTYGNVTIRIYRPELTVEERQDREAQVIAVMQHIGTEMRKGEMKIGN